MRHTKFPHRLYLVISTAACKHYSLLEVAEKAIQGGVDIIQLREKTADVHWFTTRALQLKEITSRYNIPLIINDHLQVAKQVDATGIHVGASDIAPSLIKNQWQKKAIIGYSIEALEQLTSKEAKLADYLAASPIYKTSTKVDTKIEWGLSGLRHIRSLTPKPLVAIGNMHAENAGQVIDAGADCIAVVSAICSAPHPDRAAEKIRNQIEKNL